MQKVCDEEREKSKLRFTINKDLKKDKRISVGRVLFSNRDKIINGFQKLSPLEIYTIRRESLLTIQEFFCDVMERNPDVFKVAEFLSNRRRRMKEPFKKKDIISFESQLRPTQLLERAKEVFYELKLRQSSIKWTRSP